MPPGIGLKLSLSDSATWLYEYTRLAVNDRVNDTKLGVYFCPGVISHRKAAIALNDLLAQQGPLARFPERCRVDDPVAKRTAIGTIAARDRAWNADELGPHFVDGKPHRRIAVPAHFHGFKVRGKCRIGNGVSALQVTDSFWQRAVCVDFQGI